MLLTERSFMYASELRLHKHRQWSVRRFIIIVLKITIFTFLFGLILLLFVKLGVSHFIAILWLVIAEKFTFLSIFASLIGSNLSETTWYLELPVSWDRKVAWFAELVCLYFEHVWWYVLLIRYLLYFGNVLMLNTEYKYPDRGQPINQRILCCFSTMLGEFWFFMYGIYFMYRIFMFVPKFLCASFERLDLGCKDSFVEHFVYISWSCELLL